MAPNILVLNPLAQRHLDTITSVLPNAKITLAELETAHQYCQDTDILVAWGQNDISPLLTLAPNLKWIHALSAGIEGFLVPEITSGKYLVTNSKGIHGIPISEHVFGMILSFTRNLHILYQQKSEKKWHRVSTDEIYEKTIGIVGLGSIGREIAKKAKCFGMKVHALKREMTHELFVDELFAPEDIFKMLPSCDFVVLALPLTKHTEKYFSAEHFKSMKESAYFINISRGTIVDETALIDALENKLIAGAGLDVFYNEPLPENNPLWSMPNVIITPHMAAISPYYMDRAIKLFADNLTRFNEGGQMLNIIDFEKGY